MEKLKDDTFNLLLLDHVHVYAPYRDLIYDRRSTLVGHADVYTSIYKYWCITIFYFFCFLGEEIGGTWPQWPSYTGHYSGRAHVHCHGRVQLPGRRCWSSYR